MSMTKIAEVTVGAGGAASIDFANIPGTYTDLMVVASIKSENSDNNLYFKFNNTTANTAWRNLLGYGTGVLSQTGSGYLAGGGMQGVTANTFGNMSIYIPNYSSNKTKSASVDAITEANQSTAYQFITANLWNDTTAINQVTLYLQTGNIAQYSNATLYGISKVPAAGIQPKATGGDIYQNGAYTYHVFNASGTFTPTVAIPNAEMLVVAGGAGGGGNFGGGGGAGGVISFTGQSLPASAHTVTVGAGGGASTNGVNSQFAALTAAVAGGTGGDGRGAQNVTANSGGSGGGGGGGNTAGYTGTGGAGTSGQGYAGGNGIYNRIGGGGGGAGGAGATASGSTAGMGGAATSLYSVWTNATSVGVSGVIAGGGGGASLNGYGSANVGGGGGAGNGTSNSSPGGNATANTGSGGGAGSGNSYGGNGGSGIVIIRYA